MNPSGVVTECVTTLDIAGGSMLVHSLRAIAVRSSPGVRACNPEIYNLPSAMVYQADMINGYY